MERKRVRKRGGITLRKGGTRKWKNRLNYMQGRKGRKEGRKGGRKKGRKCGIILIN